MVTVLLQGSLRPRQPRLRPSDDRGERTFRERDARRHALGRRTLAELCRRTGKHRRIAAPSAPVPGIRSSPASGPSLRPHANNGTDPATARFSRTTEQTGCKNVTTSRAFLRLRRFPFCPPFPRTNRLHAISESPIREFIFLSVGFGLPLFILFCLIPLWHKSAQAIYVLSFGLYGHRFLFRLSPPLSLSTPRPRKSV